MTWRYCILLETRKIKLFLESTGYGESCGVNLLVFQTFSKLSLSLILNWGNDSGYKMRLCESHWIKRNGLETAVSPVFIYREEMA